eukprot:TRINITY_DN37939_c0_g1_i1.p1 TRINITY_DN37939_c0_g1~~TRINITY_DN37939_c0_g1_i1.p1  ORF type:complete len:123 (+),score=18.20 TRINITY_DN37939_c0_g1_i1:154-522(+)
MALTASRLPLSSAAPAASTRDLVGSGAAELASQVQCPQLSSPSRGVVVMKNPHEGKGVFAPIVVVAKNVIGQKQFNQLRGKGIALHSQVITEFCKSIGADAKQRQGLIRLAKKNGEKLGFLA